MTTDLGFDEYLSVALQTAQFEDMTPNEIILYLGLGLAGEAGEVANKLKKILRDDNGVLSNERRKVVLEEIGDVTWYAAVLSWYLEIDFSDVARLNMKKLAERLKNGTISGDGDWR